MATEQAGANQPEAIPYDTDLHNDVAAAVRQHMQPEAPATDKPAEITEKALSDGKVTAPTEKPVETKTDGDRARDEQGRFAKVEAKDEPKPDVAKPATDKPAEQQTLPLEQPKPVAVAPPTSWEIKAKAEWDKLPQVVRDNITRREAEVSKGFAGYQAEWQGLKPFAERAKAQGQTLTQVVGNLVGMEDLLRRDRHMGYFTIAQQMGMTQYEAAQDFAALAQRLGYAPSNGQAPTNQNGFGGSPADQNVGADPMALRQVIDPVIAPYIQRLEQHERNLAQQAEVQKRQAEAEYNQRLKGVESVIEQFRQDPKHRYYDNLEEDISNLLNSGMVKKTGDHAADLARAYDKAARANDEIWEEIVKEKNAKEAQEKALAAEKAKQASRSVSGSPSPGASGLASKRDGRMSYDEDLHNDVAAAVRLHGARA